VSLRLRCALDRRLTGDTFGHLLAIPWEEVARRPLGDLAHRLTTAIALRDALIGGLVSTVLDAGFVLASLVLLVRVNSVLAATAAAIAAFRLVLAVVGHRKVAAPARDEWKHQGEQITFQMRALEQIESLKACGLEAAATDRFRALHEGTLAITVRRARISAWLEAGQNAIGLAGPLALLLVGARLMAAGNATAGDVVSAAALGALVLGPVASLAQTTSQFSYLSLWAARLEDLLDVPRECPPAPSTRPSSRERAHGVLSLERIRYRPARRDDWVLDDLDLELAPGDHVVVRGRSGAGKTTMVRVLLGLVTPDAGSVRLAGRPLGAEDFAALRARTGVVLQSPRLLPGTVRENLALLDPHASDAALEQAARIAAIHDELIALPRGYDTLLLDGQELSGGQIQRLVLARALVRTPELLVLDEPTNQLDPGTEARVLDRLADLGCTCLIVAHGDVAPQRSLRSFEMRHGRLHVVTTDMPRNGTFSDPLLPHGVG